MSEQHEGHLHAKIGQYALITNSKNEILLFERERSKKWSLPGGRIDQEDDWDVSLAKEIKEETGLEVTNPKPIATHIIEDQWQTKYCVYFSVSVTNIDSLKLSPEHSSYKWFSVGDLEGMVIDDEPKITAVILDYLSSVRS